MQIRAFFDPPTHTLTYLVWEESTRDAVVIDPVLDYDPAASRTGTTRLDLLCDAIASEKLDVHWILETHAHADHLSGAQLLKRRCDAPIAIGAGITTVQATFQKIFDLPNDFPTDGSQFDKLVQHAETFSAGSLAVSAIATPGHTPACLTYRIGDAAFTGDALFMHDYGTGRTDFPGGSAKDLYASVHERLYALPDATRVFVGHDYQPGGRELRFETTIARSKLNNPQLAFGTSQEDFVRFRTERDATLRAPRLLYPSIQVNVNAGRLPAARESGARYLTLPLNLGSPTDDAGDLLAQPAGGR